MIQTNFFVDFEFYVKSDHFSKKIFEICKFCVEIEKPSQDLPAKAANRGTSCIFSADQNRDFRPRLKP